MHRSRLLLLPAALLVLVPMPARALLPDACTTVTGQAVAQVLGGRLLEVRSVPPSESGTSKCVYSIATQGSAGEQRATIVLWLMPADDFEAMRKGQEKPVAELKGLGDAAFQVFHDDTHRFDLVALKRNRATVEVTADAADTARKIVELALGKL